MKVERQSETDMIAENLERLDVYRYPFSFPHLGPPASASLRTVRKELEEAG